MYIVEKERSYEKSVENKYKKVIPDRFSDMLTPQILAVWFMDDGVILSKGVNSKYGIVIDCTNYNLKDIYIIQETLFSKFSLKTSLHKSSKKNRNNSTKLFVSAFLFKSIVSPYIIESMEYNLSHIV